MLSIHPLLYFKLPFIDTFAWLRPPGPYRAMTCRERELTVDHIQTFLTTQGHGGPPRIRNQLNDEATSETTRTRKPIHIIHSHILTRRIWEGWLWWSNDIRRPGGPKASWHLPYRWGKSPKKPHPGNLSIPGIEPGSTAWQALILPPAPQRWTCNAFHFQNLE